MDSGEMERERGVERRGEIVERDEREREIDSREKVREGDRDR